MSTRPETLAFLLDGRLLPALPQVLIFGAGHVGRALSRALSLLPLRPILIDQRAEELALACGETRLTPLPEAEIRDAPGGTSYLILTHDHALDFLLAQGLLHRVDALNGFIVCQHLDCPHESLTLVCEICGRVTEFDGSDTLAALRAAAAASGFQARRADVVLSGTCRECQA